MKETLVQIRLHWGLFLMFCAIVEGMIFTSFSPNTEGDDVRLAGKLIFQPWKWKRGNAVGELEEKFKKYLPVSHAFSCANGRTALYTILTALGVGAGDEVLIQAYTCVAVPEPVLWRKAKPVYVDCKKESLNMSPEDLRKKITPKSKAIVIQHTFGNPAEMSKLLEIARGYGLFVIEDCAHALGAEYKGKKVGTFGDASFFSFGRDKVVSSVFGGMIATNDNILAEKIQKITEDYKYPSFVWIKRQLLHPLILNAAKKTYIFFGLGKMIMKIARTFHIISVAVEKTELSGGVPSFAFKKMPNALALLALNQFEKLERFNKHRKMIADFYYQKLKDEKENGKLEMLAENPDAKNIFLRFPIFLDNPKKLIAFAKTRHIELGNWYTEPIAPKGVVFDKIGYASSPVAEDSASRSANLPTGIQVSLKDAEQIVAVVKEYLSDF